MAKENTDNLSNYTNSASPNTPDRNPVTRDPNPAVQFQDDEISLKELILKLQEWWRYLLSKWLIILIAGLVGGALGLVYSIYNKPTYTASLTFVLEEEGGGGLGNLGGLAAMAGFNIGGGAVTVYLKERIFSRSTSLDQC